MFRVDRSKLSGPKRIFLIQQDGQKCISGGGVKGERGMFFLLFCNLEMGSE